MAEDYALAARIYADIASEVDFPVERGQLTLGDVARFVGGAMGSMTSDQTRQMFSRPDLLSAYRAMVARVSVVTIPARAAASTGTIWPQSFNGGQMNLVKNRETRFTLVVTLDPDRRGHPIDLLLMSKDGVERVTFQFAPDEDGRTVRIIDAQTPEGMRLIDLLNDPDTIKDVVRKEPAGP